MKIFLKNSILLFLFLSVICGYGQISPGDLSQAHAKLEGMTNCTQCHEIGEKVQDSKCLECHKEIQSLINNKKGLHANPTVIKKDCFQCHSDHNGRKFEMARFDQDNFKHDDTGYKLEGKHNTIDCNQCHKPDFIEDSEIRKRTNTFLGLNQECLTCHDDFHQNTLPKDCKQCHDFESFKPASKFNHDKADFKLLGKHVEVDCIKCHKKTTRNGEDFQEFTGIAFQDCKSCHEDPHESKLPGDCKSCHTETDFKLFNGQTTFDHSTTNFTLKGKHAEVDCFACHKETTNPLLVFQDNLRIKENNCVKCHKDQHEGKFGLDCAKCHNETSFFALKSMKSFNHDLTDYPLEGKHLQVDCKQCHKGRYTKAIDFSACNKCHVDYHKGEFKENGIVPDCVTCHSLQEGFDYSLFTLEKHQETEFPLKGAHVATPCFACHVSEKEERWTFTNLGSDCKDCHNDIHDGFISKKFYPDNDCKTCHINESWSKINSFDHNKTKFRLDGKHTEVDCRACHFIEKSDNNVVTIQKFANLDTKCESCHENKHGDTFAIEGVTDCKRCHVTSSWFPENFDHNTTNFPLEGRHAEIDCKACHISETINGKAQVIYKLNKFECVDCHS
ncbi:cytochrome c3 family protein [Yeosuana marina]|uniref:cytochrome c3 family protein n=1 Tax=Yeosuana marina TaxID=1565536 RepID=UPI00141DFAD3|nr:cytochrome c3 family protein [Yeosuana marina]